MSASYATPVDLEAFLAADHETVTDPERLLARATELLDGYVGAVFEVGDDELPTDTIVAGNLRDAVCAQVEFWLELGEEHDITGLQGGVSIGNLRIDNLPPKLAPRAARILSAGALFGSAVVDGVLA